MTHFDMLLISFMWHIPQQYHVTTFHEKQKKNSEQHLKRSTPLWWTYRAKNNLFISQQKSVSFCKFVSLVVAVSFDGYFLFNRMQFDWSSASCQLLCYKKLSSVSSGFFLTRIWCLFGHIALPRRYWLMIMCRSHWKVVLLLGNGFCREENVQIDKNL